MKKILSIVLCLVLALASLSAIAENDNWITYENEKLGYSIMFPGDWIPLDAVSIMLLAEASDLEYLDGISVDDFLANLAQDDLVTFLDINSDCGANYSIDVMDLGMELDATLLSMILCPALIEQLKINMPGATILDEGSVVKAGKHSYAYIHLTNEYDGVITHSEQYFICNGESLITITVTVDDPEYAEINRLIQYVLETLAF